MRSSDVFYFSTPNYRSRQYNLVPFNLRTGYGGLCNAYLRHSLLSGGFVGIRSLGSCTHMSWPCAVADRFYGHALAVGRRFLLCTLGRNIWLSDCSSFRWAATFYEDSGSAALCEHVVVFRMRFNWGFVLGYGRSASCLRFLSQSSILTGMRGPRW